MAQFKGQKIPICYASCSIGHNDKHTLPEKLKAIAGAGFDAIELSMPDILTYGQQISETKKEIDPKDYATLRSVAQKIGELCKKEGLKILILQPFANFEGWPKGSPERDDAFDRAKGWMSIMEATGTDMMQIGSSDAEGISSSFDYLASDLAELADIFAEKGFRIAYENWCWATHAPTWKDVWEIVKKADRPNLGLCLDTFQSAGGEWGSPMTKSGLIEDVDKSELDKRWKASCEELAKTVPAEKIFFLQISDAYKMDPPLEDKPDESGLRPRGQWSHDYRPVPYNGGYLPVEDFTKAVLATGFRGWLSMEVFDGKAPEKYGDDMTPYAKGAFVSLQKLLNEAGA
ncbi:hypothetical protein LTR10_016886 [Elasticomyces elasticus]|uniref:Xylose isomerase-like TIM barrel domain-containing protein n=1 Tax=Exophiala sideris TaxID=1016849 RepID=A0ABR0JLE2_9EURO|nr:hypothetical protein LTR10_016886 [Elasticomyces elasticus]KAK5035345.1 hypothetical protein LTS07_002781 [Exophiala sideris]KAK5039304.1 hypothetical protein LTR13_003561 [Exophiala sideris]KAK5066269.1 hypothetical protein LTR69_002787 [Exophiala sideris]KAK5186946.1 hypothetical protein LTR44_000952 [Eurotiomycetes sp. CCFEE 6388]